MREILATNHAQTPEKNTTRAQNSNRPESVLYKPPAKNTHDEHAIFTHARRAGQNTQVSPQERDGGEARDQKVPDLDEGHDPATLLQHARARNRRELQVRPALFGRRLSRAARGRRGTRYQAHAARGAAVPVRGAHDDYAERSQ